VVYKDRKKRKDENAVLEIIGGSKMLMSRINTKIAEYRKEIRKCMKKNKIKDLEKLYTTITEFEKTSYE
jgi:transcriptional accessory protein Tex/SPT6